MDDRRKFEAWISGQDLQRSLELFEKSGLLTISEYTRRCCVLGAAYFDQQYMAKICELSLGVNRLSVPQQTARACQCECATQNAVLVKSLKRTVKMLWARTPGPQ